MGDTSHNQLYVKINAFMKNISRNNATAFCQKRKFQELIQQNYNYWVYPEGLPCTFMNLLKQVAQLPCKILKPQNWQNSKFANVICENLLTVKSIQYKKCLIHLVDIILIYHRHSTNINTRCSIYISISFYIQYIQYCYTELTCEVP